MSNVGKFYIPITVAKQNGIIKEPWHKYFKDTCKYCAHEMVISNTRAEFKCNNPYCGRRVAGQIVGLLQDLDYKNIGIKTALAWVQTGTDSVIKFLLEPPVQLYHIVQDIESREFNVPQLVRLLHIPRLDLQAEQIFKGVDSWEDFIAQVKDAGTLEAYIQQRIGGDIQVAAMVDTLLDYEADIQAMLQLVKPVKQAGKIIDIVITGFLTQSKTEENKRPTKSQYLAALNRKARQINIQFRDTSAINSVQFVVADEPTTNNNYVVGEKRGVIITSAALMSVVDTMIQEEEENKEVATDAESTEHFTG